jgi:hypothetical protein
MDLKKTSELALLPQPRFLDLTGGSFRWQIVPGASPTIRLQMVSDASMHPQGYELTIMDEGVTAIAASPAGIFYAVQTLLQLLQHAEGSLPCLLIRDWPDFPNRGVMLDISRDKVPTMETLFSLVDMLAKWKINQFQLYTEHTFAYQNHPVVWAESSPVTAEEIQELDRYCRARFIDLVPNQNSFGHMRRWLIHDEYKHLAECPHGCKTLWGYFDEPFSLAPAEPRTLDFLRGLYDELLPNFSSGLFNVGCDETVDLGQGRSKDLVARRGTGRVYLDFLLDIYRLVSSHGRTMQFWGDIVREYPDLVEELPRDLVALEWGYEAKHSFDKNGALFADSKIPFYVCPGTSSWNSVAGRTENALANLANAAENGLKHGAVGYLNTDWGDDGHWQPLPVSYLGYAYGAAVSWAVEANLDIDNQAALNAFAFLDRAGFAGQAACDLGNVYQSTEVQLPNRTVLFQVLQYDPDGFRLLVCPDGDIDQALKRFHGTLDTIDEITTTLSLCHLVSADADLIQDEFAWAASMLRHACWRSIWSLQIEKGEEDKALRRKLQADAGSLMAQHEVIWHTRNRPGGFKDSQARLQKMAKAYEIS